MSATATYNLEPMWQTRENAVKGLKMGKKWNLGKIKLQFEKKNSRFHRVHHGSPSKPRPRFTLTQDRPSKNACGCSKLSSPSETSASGSEMEITKLIHPWRWKKKKVFSDSTGSHTSASLGSGVQCSSGSPGQRLCAWRRLSLSCRNPTAGLISILM